MRACLYQLIYLPHENLSGVKIQAPESKLRRVYNDPTRREPTGIEYTIACRYKIFNYPRRVAIKYRQSATVTNQAQTSGLPISDWLKISKTGSLSPTILLRADTTVGYTIQL